MVNAVVKKWGNSYGVILPINVVRNHHITENDVIDIKIKKKVKPINSLFGTLKLKKSTQKVKDELRAGWDD